MLHHLKQIISKDQAARACSLLTGKAFVSGKSSAIGVAQQVKNNLELLDPSSAVRALSEEILATLRRSVPFGMAALPRTTSSLFFNRYDEGMSYGDHLDDALLTEPGLRLRSDVAVTIFLSDAASYDGGELVIDTDYGIQRLRGDAGDCIVYPADKRHRVEPVRRGQRLAAVMWVQSMVRDSARRQLLYDLAQGIAGMDAATADKTALERLHRSHLNLLRMWVDL
jgi:PKHD-type hydroxylase